MSVQVSFDDGDVGLSRYIVRTRVVVVFSFELVT